MRTVILKLGVGTKVLIEVKGDTQEWEIVDAGESDIPNGKISRDAPLTKCILGAREGGRINCKIMDDGVTVVVKSVSSIFKKFLG